MFVKGYIGLVEFVSAQRLVPTWQIHFAASSEDERRTNKENSLFNIRYKNWTSGSGAADCNPIILVAKYFSTRFKLVLKEVLEIFAQ